MIPKPISIELPLTIDEAVNTILNDLPLLDRTRLSAMKPDDLRIVDREIGPQIARDFRLCTGNDILLSECLVASQQYDPPPDPTWVILHAVWQRLQQIHVLRLVKT